VREGKGGGEGKERGREREGEGVRRPPFRVGIGPPEGLIRDCVCEYATSEPLPSPISPLVK